MKVQATKASLMRLKSLLSFAKKGYNLMDKKRLVLNKEYLEVERNAKKLREELNSELKASYEALEVASMTMSWQEILDLSKAMPQEEEFLLLYCSVMGV